MASPALAVPDLSKSTTGNVSDGTNSMPYRLFRPTGYDAPGAKFPLVLFMHGAGERGTNNTSQVNSHIDGLVNATQSAAHAAYLVAPQVPSGQQFVDVPFNTGAYTNASAPPQSTSMKLTIQLLDQLLATGTVDPDRVYVTGLSMGGYGTWDIMGRRPGLFAAAVPMSGGGNTSTAGAIKHIPTWAFHNPGDGTVPSSGSTGMVNAVNAAGGSALYNTMSPTNGHGPWATLYNDDVSSPTGGNLYEWMFAQALPEPGSLGFVVVGAFALLRRRRARA